MTDASTARPSKLRTAWGNTQNRNTAYLTLNSVAGTSAGVLFWLLLVRVAHLPASDVGAGYAIVALGTTVGLLAKGGLDTAILRNVPGANTADGVRLLRFGATVGCMTALVIAAGIMASSRATTLFPQFALLGWALVAAIGCLMVVTWLQDAYLLAEGAARSSLHRNLVLSGARVILPLPIVLLALPFTVPLIWALALGCSALAAFVFGARLPQHDGRFVPRREFLVSAARNATGSSAEFLPGLLLAPLVYAIDGAAASAYFAIAWTAAAALLHASAAVSRSAMSEMVRDPKSQRAAIRRGIWQNVIMVAPAAVAGIILAPLLLGIFGPAYASQGSSALMVLCASLVFVAPAYLYLAVLRAQEKPLMLVIFPAAMVVALGLLAPPIAAKYGLTGVAAAWLLANVPFGIYAAFKLHTLSKGVTPTADPTDASPVHHRADLE